MESDIDIHPYNSKRKDNIGFELASYLLFKMVIFL